MSTVLDAHLAGIRILCRRSGVRKLEVFGSATTSVFDAQCSDLDLLVEFDDDPAHLFDRYFGLKEAFEALCGRSVDLVTVGSLKNPYFISEVNKTRQVVYAAEGAEAA